jgi:hypothetical protein
MRSRPPSRCVLLACLSVAAILGWQEFLVHFRYGGVQTALFFTGAGSVPPPLQVETYRFPNSGGYDGQFYRYVAHDPFFRRGFSRYIDDPRYRYGRILVPIIAWAASGGQDQWIDRAFQLTVVFFCGLGVYWTCRWISLSDCPPLWGAAAFLLLPATLASAERLVLDGPLCALFGGYLYYARLGRWKAMYVIATIAPLVRETGILILAGILAAAFFEKRWGSFAVFCTAAVPTLAWTLYIAPHTPSAGAIHIFQRPVTGLFLRLFTVIRYYPGLNKSRYLFMQSMDFLAMAGFILCLALAAKWIWKYKIKRRDGVVFTVASFLLLGLLLGHPGHLMSAYGYSRPLSPLILWVVLMALESRKWTALVPPALVSAGVAIYPAYATLRALEALLRL